MSSDRLTGSLVRSSSSLRHAVSDVVDVSAREPFVSKVDAPEEEQAACQPEASHAGGVSPPQDEMEVDDSASENTSGIARHWSASREQGSEDL